MLVTPVNNFTTPLNYWSSLSLLYNVNSATYATAQNMVQQVMMFFFDFVIFKSLVFISSHSHCLDKCAMKQTLVCFYNEISTNIDKYVLVGYYDILYHY